jgi:hypothetical protein
MSRVLFLSTARFKKSTPVQQNVDDDLINNYIWRAQETHLHQALGTDLYNSFKNKVINNQLSGDYKDLMDDYIIPALIEWSFYELLPFISLKLTNKSIGRGNADYLAEADLADLKYLRQTVRDIAEFQSTRLINYLKQYTWKFPEYLTNSGIDKIIPNSSSYFSGVYLGGGRSKDCDWGLGDKWKDIM